MLGERIRSGKVLVVGMARSGLAAVRFLLDLGAKKVIANDHRGEAEVEREMGELAQNPRVELVAGGHHSHMISDDVSLIVKSPGVPPHLEIFTQARLHQIPVISEIELAYPFLKAPVIGITGTNGKTTTTRMTAEIFQEGQMGRVYTAGNIGKPLVEVAGEATAGDVIVAELSSFQLDDIISFRPFVAVLLNITADHLNYHGTRENYISAKGKILNNQGPADVAIFNAADEDVVSMQKHTAATCLYFTNEQVSEKTDVNNIEKINERVNEQTWEGFCVREGCLGLNRYGRFEVICREEELPIPGKHNRENALAAAAAAWAGGVDLGTIGRALKAFSGVEHRLEWVRKLAGVTFINDSKGTNPGASEKALESFPGQEIILIAGGMDKEADFHDLAFSIQKNGVRHLILLGETAAQIESTVKEFDFNNVQRVETVEEAVHWAWEHSQNGDVVLFSPACASWDMFRDYEERGQLFKDIVNNLDVE